MDTRRERVSRHSSWTVRRSNSPCSPRSSARLERSERLREFAEALPPARASRSRRCRSSSRRSTSSSAAALVGARCPRTPTRATSPRRRRWFLGAGARRAPAEPRRPLGLRASSRRRTSSASARARSTCSRRAGSSASPRRRSPSGMPPRDAAARSRSASRRATSRASRGWPRRSRSRGYERVERAEERGQFAVRGGLVDVFPTTGREPLRDRVLRRRDRAGPRVLAVHAARAAPGRRRRRLPGGRAAPRRSTRVTAVLETRASCRASPSDLVPVLDRAPDLVWEPARCARSGTRRWARRRST